MAAADPKIEEFYARVKAQGNFLATADPYAYSKADVVVVDVNLDVAKGGDVAGAGGFAVHLDGFRSAIRTIGEHCREDALVLVETTVPPGTCAKIVQPILLAALAARVSRSIACASDTRTSE